MRSPDRKAEAPAPCDSQRGAALLVVIALMAILAAIATAYLAAVSVQSKAAANLAESIRAEAAADGAANLLIWALERTGARIGEASFECVLGEYEMKILVEDEAAKLNVNIASEQELSSAILAAGFDAQEAALIAARIKDYLAAAGRARTRTGEDPESEDGASERGAIELLDEIILAASIDEIKLKRMERVLSVYSRRASLNTRSPGGAASGARMVRMRVAARRGEAVRFVRRAVVEFDDLSGVGRAVREWRRGFPAEFAAISFDSAPAPACAELFIGRENGL